MVEPAFFFFDGFESNVDVVEGSDVEVGGAEVEVEEAEFAISLVSSKSSGTCRPSRQDLRRGDE